MCTARSEQATFRSPIALWVKICACTAVGDWLARPTCLQAYAADANFEGADMTNAVVDRVDFSKANLK
jgi:uncharacterized protein YjbI with pentapeptide repeats